VANDFAHRNHSDFIDNKDCEACNVLNHRRTDHDYTDSLVEVSDQQAAAPEPSCVLTPEEAREHLNLHVPAGVVKVAVYGWKPAAPDAQTKQIGHVLEVAGGREALAKSLKYPAGKPAAPAKRITPEQLQTVFNETPCYHKYEDRVAHLAARINEFFSKGGK